MKTKLAGITNRRNALTGKQRQEIVRLNSEGKLSWNQLAHQYAVSRMTIYRIVKRGRDATPEQEARNDPEKRQQAVLHDIRPRVYNSYG